MASFSPAPRLRPHGHSPRRMRLVSPGGRLSTPMSSSGFYNEDQFEEDISMNADDSMSLASEKQQKHAASGIIFAKSDQLTVSFYANLPIEITQIMKNTDFHRDMYSGTIDSLSGFALVVSLQTCFVWQHTQSMRGIPTCYIFACPNSTTVPPFHALVPRGYAREPGLVLISETGEIRFWESIGIGLAGGDQYSATFLELNSKELVTNLIRADSQTFIASTSLGSLFRLVLTSSGGKHHLSSHRFSQPQSNLGLIRLIPFFGTSKPTGPVQLEAGNINAVTVYSQGEEFEVWALLENRVRKWLVRSDGSEELALDYEILTGIRSAIRTHFGSAVEDDDARLDLELIDLSAPYVRSDTARNSQLILLVSYASREEATFSTVIADFKRSYALAGFSVGDTGIDVAYVKAVPYQSTISSGAPIHPRMHLLNGGLLVFVQFGDAVVLCARDSDYTDRLELKTTTNRSLGIGISHNDSAALILTATTMMKAHVELDRVERFDAMSGRGDLVQSTITQAILYGSSPLNPLRFSFPPELDEDSLMRGAEQLSKAVLRSDPALITESHDIGSLILARGERLRYLIDFINDNAVLTKLSRSCRQQLLADAEKISACHELWIQHNALLASGTDHSVLNDVVYAYMCESHQLGSHPDFMRAFFRHCVHDIGAVVQQVPQVTLHTAQETGRSVQILLPEANRIVLAVLSTAFEFRKANIGTYGLDSQLTRPWTSESRVIDTVQTLFENTARYRTPNERMPDSEPGIHLPGLARLLFCCFDERLAGQREDTDGLTSLTQRFEQLRPEIFGSLWEAGYAEAAFELAEQYHDFSSLAALCNRETVYPHEKNPQAQRIRGYLARYREEFANQLFTWYIQHGELRTMFTMDLDIQRYLDGFFAHYPNPSVSWIYTLGRGQYDITARTLLEQSQRSKLLEPKHLMLSVGKLSHLAGLQENEGHPEDTLLDAFHDNLDFISVHDALCTDFNSLLQGARGRQPLDLQLDVIMQERFPGLSEKPILSMIMKDSIKKLLQGHALSIEDMVDLLSAKDNQDSVEDLATALQLLKRDTLTPLERRDSACRTVWRRIYLHDDWTAIQNSASLSDAEQKNKLRGTAFYYTLRAIGDLEKLVRSPDEALIVPQAEEIVSRWPGLSADQVNDLTQEYDLERDMLGEVSWNDGLEVMVRELVLHDRTFGIDL